MTNHVIIPVNKQVFRNVIQVSTPLKTLLSEGNFE